MCWFPGAISTWQISLTDDPKLNTREALLQLAKKELAKPGGPS